MLSPVFRIRVSLLTYGTTSHLYVGQNGNQQNVLTWLASETTESFSGDIAPLLTELPTLNIPTLNVGSLPAASDYLGYWSLGSEAFSSNANVTFSVPMLSVEIQT